MIREERATEHVTLDRLLALSRKQCDDRAASNTVALMTACGGDATTKDLLSAVVVQGRMAGRRGSEMSSFDAILVHLDMYSRNYCG